MKLLVLPIVLFITIGLNAQQPLIAIKGSVTDTIAFTLQQAIDIAQPNDKIYLPGGTYSLTDSIQKNVHIIGTGFDHQIERLLPVTIFTNNILIGSQSNGLIIEGVKINNDLRIFSYNVSVKRCLIMNNLILGSNNITIINVFVANKLTGANPTTGVNYNSFNIIVSNSLFCGIDFINNSTINNSIIGPHFGTTAAVRSCHNLIITNTILSSLSIQTNPNFNHYSSNIVFQNSFQNTGFFNNFSLSIPLSYFNSDFSLIVSPETSNIGVYHGDFPWKDGGQPINPHILENNSFLDVQNEEFKLRVKVVPQTN